MTRQPSSERRRRSPVSGPVGVSQGELFARPGDTGRTSAPSPRPYFPSASAEDAERARIGTLLMLFQLLDADGFIGHSASLWFVDALSDWHRSRPIKAALLSSSDDDVPF